MTIDPFRLEAAAIDLGRDIASRKIFGSPAGFDVMVRETLLAVTASRMRWELACDIVDQLLKKARVKKGGSEFTICVGAKAIASAAVRHRFPERYGNWLDELFANHGGVFASVARLMESGDSPAAIRKELVRQVPGVGPKAASLLLRNVGLGGSLAVLDVHLLDFMRLVGLSDGTVRTLTTITRYEAQENLFVAYAEYRRVPADALDLAAWTVMRLMKERKPIEHRDTGIWGPRLDTGRGHGGRAGARPVPAFY